jgi:hypothetical protein
MSILDEHIKDECTFVEKIGLQGEYIYLKYYIYSENGVEAVEEHIKPKGHKSGVESTMIKESIKV